MQTKDIFISYKAEEFDKAQWVKATLESNGISCWMAPECIPGGTSYASEIPKAIRACKVFVLILSSKAQQSVWVPKEVDLAINTGKTLMPFMIEDCPLTDAFTFYLSNVQRFAAYENETAAIEKLIREIKGVTTTPVASPAENISATYDVILTNIGRNKIKVVKLVKNLTNAGLKNSKDLVDNAPSLLAKAVSKDEAERIKRIFEAAGALISIR